jgi:hypothetical protein
MILVVRATVGESGGGAVVLVMVMVSGRECS